MIFDNGRCILFTNGILAEAESPEEWNKQAAAFVEQRGIASGREFSYSCEIVGGAVLRSREARELTPVLKDIQTTFIIRAAVGHSDGCPMTTEALLNDATLYYHLVALLAPAMDCDCEKNGLNELARRGQVGKLLLFVSPADAVLGIAVISYGQLGKYGPLNICPELQAIMTIVPGTGGHSSWVNELFEWSIGQVVDSLPLAH